jgi:hypothetical protein
MTPITKFCVDCKWCDQHTVPKCLHPGALKSEDFAVYGSSKSPAVLRLTARYCANERTQYGACGLDGRNWEKMVVVSFFKALKGWFGK